MKLIRYLICWIKTRHKYKEKLWPTDILSVDSNRNNKITKVRINYRCKNCGWPTHEIKHNA